jgi:hypothetical protein
MRTPSGTGFVDDLYINPLAVAGQEHSIEERFMSRVDQRANDALIDLIADVPLSHLLRDGWTRFIMSLWQRTPSVMASIPDRLAAATEETIEEMRALFEQERRPTDPETFEEFRATLTPEWFAARRASVLPRLIDLKNLGNHIKQMKWGIITIANPRWRLLTSDAAVQRPRPLNMPDAFIVLPVGPRQFFVATNSVETRNRIFQAAEGTGFCRVFNKTTCRQADRLVIGTDDSQLRFVENHLRGVAA